MLPGEFATFANVSVMTKPMVAGRETSLVSGVVVGRTGSLKDVMP